MSYVRNYRMGNNAGTIELPFRIQFHFKKLIAWWEKQAAAEDSLELFRAREVLKRLEKAPELRTSFDHPDLIEKYQQEVQLMLSPFFPSLTTTNETKAAVM